MNISFLYVRFTQRKEKRKLKISPRERKPTNNGAGKKGRDITDTSENSGRNRSPTRGSHDLLPPVSQPPPKAPFIFFSPRHLYGHTHQGTNLPCYEYSPFPPRRFACRGERERETPWRAARPWHHHRSRRRRRPRRSSSSRTSSSTWPRSSCRRRWR